MRRLRWRLLWARRWWSDRRHSQRLVLALLSPLTLQAYHRRTHRPLDRGSRRVGKDGVRGRAVELTAGRVLLPTGWEDCLRQSVTAVPVRFTARHQASGRFELFPPGATTSLSSPTFSAQPASRAGRGCLATPAAAALVLPQRPVGFAPRPVFGSVGGGVDLSSPRTPRPVFRPGGLPGGTAPRPDFGPLDVGCFSSAMLVSPRGR